MRTRWYRGRPEKRRVQVLGPAQQPEEFDGSRGPPGYVRREFVEQGERAFAAAGV